MKVSVTRRDALGIGAGIASAIVIGPVSPAHAKNDSEELIKAFTGGKAPVRAKIKLDVPEIAENGNTVPLAFTVESPMTAASHVTDVLIVAEGNPRGGIATFHFNPASGAAEASTRIRLAETQNVIAIAKMNDGALFMDVRQVKVTIGGCGG